MLSAWPRSAQVTVAFLLGVVVTLIGAQAWNSLRWSSRPTDLERGTTLAYRVDLNRAERAELLQLPGIGPALAERIEGRRPYEHVHQLRDVAGIGPATYERLRPWVCVDEEEDGGDKPLPAPVKRSRASATTASAPASESKLVAGKKKEPATPIDINQASVEELQRLPNIGPIKAKRIADDRETKGPFKSVEDLRRVPGIGPKTIEQLRPFITVGSNPNAVVAVE
jgi:competence protein ComEA